MPKHSKRPDRIKEASKLLIAYELITGFVELFIGVLLVTLVEQFPSIYNQLIAYDLSNNSFETITEFLEGILPYVFEHHLFLSITLTAIGATKLISAWGLMRNKVWGNHVLTILLVFMTPFDLISYIARPETDNLMYLAINLVILLYLVEFDPKGYFSKAIKQYQG